MKNFNSFLREALSKPQESERIGDDLVTLQGRHNVFHQGHGKTFDAAHDIANSIGKDKPADQRFFTSWSQDPKRNPLPHAVKLHFLKKRWPEHAHKWSDDPEIRTALQAAVQGHQQGYKNFHFVGGSDRVKPFGDLFRKYNGKLYDFDNIHVHNAGDRGEEADPEDFISQLSGSKMRGFADKGKFEEFAEGVGTSKTFGPKDIRDLWNAVRLFGQKNEQYDMDPQEYAELIRERYVTGELFNPGDKVTSLMFGMDGEVHRCGANHVIVVTEDGIMFKSFIQDLHPI